MGSKRVRHNWVTELKWKVTPAPIQSFSRHLICYGLSWIFLSHYPNVYECSEQSAGLFGLEASWRQDQAGVVSSLPGGSRSTEMPCWHCLLPSSFLPLGGNMEAHKSLWLVLIFPMATHSSVLAWRIPRRAEPGGLPCMRSHRVGQDWSDLAPAAAASFPLVEMCLKFSCFPF